MVIISFTIGQYIALAVSLFFGCLETILNSMFLVKNDMEKARKQHKAELAADATDKQVKSKVIRMLILGILLLIISALSLFINSMLLLVNGALIFISGIIDYTSCKKFAPIGMYGGFMAFIWLFALLL
ncbi:MAG: hypothetical protein ACTSRZ_10195 [Promethearchaeota archaeon]